MGRKKDVEYKPERWLRGLYQHADDDKIRHRKRSNRAQPHQCKPQFTENALNYSGLAPLGPILLNSPAEIFPLFLFFHQTRPQTSPGWFAKSLRFHARFWPPAWLDSFMVSSFIGPSQPHCILYDEFYTRTIQCRPSHGDLSISRITLICMPILRIFLEALEAMRLTFSKS